MEEGAVRVHTHGKMVVHIREVGRMASATEMEFMWMLRGGSLRKFGKTEEEWRGNLWCCSDDGFVVVFVVDVKVCEVKCFTERSCYGRVSCILKTDKRSGKLPSSIYVI